MIRSTGRMYRQDYVVFLRAADGKIAFLREYFDPVRAAKALDTPILGLNPEDNEQLDASPHLGLSRPKLQIPPWTHR